MEIKSIHLECVNKEGFSTLFSDSNCHIKALPCLSVVQAIEGSYDIQLADGEVYNTGNGGFFIAPSDVRQTITHNPDKASKRMNCRWMFFKIKINEVYDFDELFDFPVILPQKYKGEMNKLFNRAFSSENLFDEKVCCYEIARILFLISSEKKRKMPYYLTQALNLIKTKYKSKISVADIAENLGLSESHFYSVFKKEMGISPIAYLNNYRLSLAANELLKTDKTISEIAYSVGIEDAIYFNKLFKKAYQMSPSKYREFYIKSRN